MSHTTVKALMTPNPASIGSHNTLKEAAEKMDELSCGVLPVMDEYGLLGIITDRDIVIRAVAQGKDVTTEAVGRYMTPSVYFCQEEDTVEEAANLMRDYRVTRLLVKNGSGDVTGIISFGCILRKDTDAKEISEVVDNAVGRKRAA